MWRWVGASVTHLRGFDMWGFMSLRRSLETMQASSVHAWAGTFGATSLQLAVSCL